MSTKEEPHPPLPPDKNNDPEKPRSTSDQTGDQTPRPRSPTAPSMPSHPSSPANLLSNLRHAFQRAEQAQYSQLSATPLSSLNNVRWSFRSTARGATKRLAAWEKKHLPDKGSSRALAEKLASKEPEWWSKGCHAVPGGNVIVREGDWGSIIAYTLGYVLDVELCSCPFHSDLVLQFCRLSK